MQKKITDTLNPLKKSLKKETHTYPLNPENSLGSTTLSYIYIFIYTYNQQTKTKHKKGKKKKKLFSTFG
jgi:hypothetical protein